MRDTPEVHEVEQVLFAVQSEIVDGSDGHCGACRLVRADLVQLVDGHERASVSARCAEPSCRQRQRTVVERPERFDPLLPVNDRAGAVGTTGDNDEPGWNTGQEREPEVPLTVGSPDGPALAWRIQVQVFAKDEVDGFPVADLCPCL